MVCLGIETVPFVLLNICAPIMYQFVLLNICAPIIYQLYTLTNWTKRRKKKEKKKRKKKQFPRSPFWDIVFCKAPLWIYFWSKVNFIFLKFFALPVWKQPAKVTRKRTVKGILQKYVFVKKLFHIKTFSGKIVTKNFNL